MKTARRLFMAIGAILLIPIVAIVVLAVTSAILTDHQQCSVVARTCLDEVIHFPPHLVEHQLAHTVRDPLGRSYNRTQHIQERRRMMQRWADWLDELRTEATA